MTQFGEHLLDLLSTSTTEIATFGYASGDGAQIRLYDNNTPEQGAVIGYSNGTFSITRDSGLAMNVGIGVTNPQKNLVVSGDTFITGSLTVNDIDVNGYNPFYNFTTTIGTTIRPILYNPTGTDAGISYKLITTNSSIPSDLILLNFSVPFGRYMITGVMPYTDLDAMAFAGGGQYATLGLYIDTPATFTGTNAIPVQSIPLNIPTTSDVMATPFVFYIDVVTTTNYIIAVAGKGSQLKFGGDGYSVTTSIISISSFGATSEYTMRQSLQSTPITSNYTVANTTNIFNLQATGQYSVTNSNNIEVFKNGLKLPYFTGSTYNYNLTTNNDSTNTYFTLILTSNAIINDTIDVTIWPQLPPAESLFQSGYLYQNIAVKYTQFIQSNSNSFYLPVGSNIGIGSTLPIATLDIQGNVNLNGTLLQNGSPIMDVFASNVTFYPNIGIGTTNTSYALQVQGNTFVTGTLTTSNLDVNSMIYSQPYTTRTGMQIASVRQVFLASVNQQTFALVGSGILTTNETNISIYQNGNKLSWYSINQNDYQLISTYYNTIYNSTTFIIALTQTASYQDIIDISIWPITPTFASYQSGFLYQNISLSESWKINNSNVYVEANSNVGIGTTLPQSALHIYGSSNMKGSLVNMQIGSYSAFSVNAETQNVGIGTTNPQAPLHVNGNMLVSGTLNANTLTFGNTITANAATINTLITSNVTVTDTLTANAIISGSFITSNLNITNTLTADTINTSSFGISNLSVTNTLTAAAINTGILTSTIVNINTLSTNTLTAATVIGNVTDTTNQGAYALINGNQNNSNLFLKWMQRTVNNTSGGYANSNVWWGKGNIGTIPNTALVGINGPSMVQIPDGRIVIAGTVFGNPTGTPAQVFNPYTNTLSNMGLNLNVTSYSATLLPDGRVLYPPAYGGYNDLYKCVFIYDVNSNVVTRVDSTLNYDTTFSYCGSVLIPDGRVIMAPQNSGYPGVYNTLNNTFYQLNLPVNGGGQGNCQGCILIPDGRVVFIPATLTNVPVFNPSTNTLALYPTNLTGNSNYWVGGALAYDGRVIFCPQFSAVIGSFNPNTNAFTYYSAPNLPDNHNYFASAISLPTGQIMFCPAQSLNFIGFFNPTTNKYYQQTFSTSITGNRGANLLSDGRVIFGASGNLSFYNSGVPVTREWALHPSFNRH